MGGAETKEKVATGADEIIERAAKRGVSDIHIEPGPRFVLVRYRHGGVQYVANKLPNSSGAELAKHFKKLAKLEVDKAAKPQIGSYELKLGRRVYNVQIATLPVINGEKLTIRLRENLNDAPSLEQLGLWGPSLVELKRALAAQQGLVLVAGRQTSRLNPTLTALLQTLQTPTLKAAFVNNHDLPLALDSKQVTVRLAAGLDAATQLKVLTREHLDAIGLSLIDSRKTAEAIITAAERTLVLAGLSADSAVASLKLFRHLESQATVRPAALAQTFSRRLCEHCREAYKPTEIELKQLGLLFKISHNATMSQLHELEKQAKTVGLEPDLPLGSNESGVKTLYRAKAHGCSYCDHTGYDGEIGIFEFCQPGAALQSALIENKSTDILQKQAINDGMVSLRVDAFIKTLRGLIDLPALLNVCAKVG